jgi:hypothetical protein
MWAPKIGTYEVRKLPVGTGAPLGVNPSACLHTTEGSALPGALSTIEGTGFAPHFTVGDDAIVQMRSLDEQGEALRAHNDHFIQIEAVGFSDLKLHELTPATFHPLVALAAYLRDQLGIPLHRPVGWTDQLPPMTWADNNPRRQAGVALRERGWYGHVDVPDQSPTWHWDPGSFDYSALFAAVEGGDEDVNLETYNEGWAAYVAAFKSQGADPGAALATKPDWFRKGWGAARFSATNPKPKTP